MKHWIARLAVCLSLQAAGVFAADVDFARDVQPLLARKCFVCHGPADQESGLGLHERTTATVAAESGRVAIVPGKADQSELIRRVTSADPDLRMPPKGEPLSATEIATLRNWIRQGADYSEHWAWQSPVLHTPPNVANEAWVRDDLDRFILARLEKSKLKPSPPADPYTLLRRLHLDLTGLPPSPQEVRQFVAAIRGDDSKSSDRAVSSDRTRLPGGAELASEINDKENSATRQRFEKAVEDVVDRLLDSPHFGERWGRHWLDLARYADSFGYERDDVRPNAWRYRDWVIDAINDDLPYDQFVIEQLAGDLLPDATIEQRTATGFNRMNVQNNESGINKEDYRNREIVDRINTTATAFLGITLGCCQCHDHKYDPYSQREYYQFYAFFNNTLADDPSIEGTPEQKAAYEKSLAEYKTHEKQIKGGKLLFESIQKAGGIRKFVATLKDGEPLRERLSLLKLNEELLTTLAIAAVDLTQDQRKLADKFDASISGRIDDANKAARQLSVEKRHLPKPAIMTLKESAKDRRHTHVLLRGDFKMKGDQVEQATPKVLNLFEVPDQEAAPNRLDLAKWIVHDDNPLTARVAVNHVWKHLFGEAIVRTMDDFGVQGDPPTHPELLDQLAVDFRGRGWSRKQLIRRIVLSSAYRQASHHRSELHSIDPDNRLLARQRRFRVESEIVRDVSLTASGLLCRTTGGPTIHPQLSVAVRDLAYKYKTRWIVSDIPDRYRRGLYIHFKRTNPYPSLITFDAPESSVCMARRNRSNSPLQALTTLNDPVFVELAQAFARRILRLDENDVESQIREAVLVALGRPASENELDTLRDLFADEANYYRAHSDEAAAFARKDESDAGTPPHEVAAWVSVSRSLLNLDEFLTRE
jgi:hypothetical protein